MTPFYRATQIFLKIVFRAKWRIDVRGTEHVPHAGAAIVVANHTNNLDPPVLGTYCWHRQIRWMAKRELFEQRYLGRLITWLGSFPVDRGHADRKAIRTALELLQQGHVIGLFPEGTRGSGPFMQPWQPGFAMIAAKACVPVVPAALLIQDGVVKIRFGPAVAVQPSKGREHLIKIQETCYGAVDALLRQMVNDGRV